MNFGLHIPTAAFECVSFNYEDISHVEENVKTFSHLTDPMLEKNAS